MQTHIVERAFQLARSGEHETLRDLDRVLSKEGYTTTDINGHLGSPMIRRQLSDLCRARRPLSRAPD